MAELGPPFGGITRIRFKGFVYDVSAIRLPRFLRQEYDREGRSQLPQIGEIRGQRSQVTGCSHGHGYRFSDVVTVISRRTKPETSIDIYDQCQV